ncbi:NRDE family protein [Psychrosphaera sp. 1_MG-2023]|uniref:NRDE family protein n=1 Tax=Psychrosphaera sp. 1_MG-2023 TaxID=3062643 RepID=UPI0026E1E792|nr:NRDE family protein [Psychrosphaera sp. 1_MG-2023]MDO6718621.1 NRDE family protein [Psychrosphaera sp. 1_MG-2023]
MCSFSWQQFGDTLTVVFNRDESTTRSKAQHPKYYTENGVRFIMPKDPDGDGSWIAANEFGFVFVLLNDYQGQVKPPQTLISRGQLIRSLASCRDWQTIKQKVACWPLSQSQPFQLGVIAAQQQMFWHYNGLVSQITPATLPSALFSSAHPDVKNIVKLRHSLLQRTKASSVEELVQLFKGHKPDLSDVAKLNLPNSQKHKCEAINGDVIKAGEGNTYSICMHRDEANTQSLSCIELKNSSIEFSYWDGQPCQVDRPITMSLPLVTADFF